MKNHSIDGKQVFNDQERFSLMIKKVDCKRAVPRDQQGEYPKEDTPAKTRKLFVGGLPQAISEGIQYSYECITSNNNRAIPGIF